MPWPANYPVLNPIGNLWGILFRRVYDNLKCYDTVFELKEAIKHHWHEADLECLQKLGGGMHNRWKGMIEAFEGHLKY